MGWEFLNMIVNHSCRFYITLKLFGSAKEATALPNTNGVILLTKGWDETERLNSDLSKIFDRDKENLVVFNASKTQFLHLSTQHNLLDNYPLFFNDTQLSPSSTLNILGVSYNLNWKLHISSLAKTASMKLGVLRGLCQFFSRPSNC
ncbi:hypothetical protein E2C01_024378 [Portunus trituberculatus]|uniref:Uncharacterized protein n=1 Tax=Portunus trituberculatus TaxID=210409 RepID=A0A5B7ECN7_PORTR|nr:hypothetical protein [Portunus trituberculatus]